MKAIYYRILLSISMLITLQAHAMYRMQGHADALNAAATTVHAACQDQFGNTHQNTKKALAIVAWTQLLQTQVKAHKNQNIAVEHQFTNTLLRQLRKLADATDSEITNIRPLTMKKKHAQNAVTFNMTINFKTFDSKTINADSAGATGAPAGANAPGNANKNGTTRAGDDYAHSGSTSDDDASRDASLSFRSQVLKLIQNKLVLTGGALAGALAWLIYYTQDETVAKEVNTNLADTPKTKKQDANSKCTHNQSQKEEPELL